MKGDGKKNPSCLLLLAQEQSADRNCVVDCCNEGPWTGQRFRRWLRALPQVCEHANPCGMMDCSYNYVVTAQKPSNVTHSTVGHFTSPQDINLIISCAAPHRPTASARASPRLTRHVNSALPGVQEMYTDRDTHAHAGRAPGACFTLLEHMHDCSLCACSRRMTRPRLASRAWQTCRCMAASPPWSSSARRRAPSHAPARCCTTACRCTQCLERDAALTCRRLSLFARARRGALGGRKTSLPARQRAGAVQRGAMRLSALRARAGRGQGPALHLHGALQVLPAGVGQRHGCCSPRGPRPTLSACACAPRLMARSCACL